MEWRAKSDSSMSLGNRGVKFPVLVTSIVMENVEKMMTPIWCTIRFYSQVDITHAIVVVDVCLCAYGEQEHSESMYVCIQNIRMPVFHLKHSHKFDMKIEGSMVGSLFRVPFSKVPEEQVKNL